MSSSKTQCHQAQQQRGFVCLFTPAAVFAANETFRRKDSTFMSAAAAESLHFFSVQQDPDWIYIVLRQPAGL